MPDINIIKTLSLKFQKAFDKGEIDKLYLKMYETAESIAVSETKLYMNKVAMEFREKLRSVENDEETPELHLSKIADYRNTRIQFHLDQMYKLLELYAKSKNTTPQT
jgi:hypothetical protein